MKSWMKYLAIGAIFALSAWLAASAVLTFFAVLLIIFGLVLAHLVLWKYWQYLFAAVLGLLLGLMILLGSVNMAVLFR